MTETMTKGEAQPLITHTMRKALLSSALKSSLNAVQTAPDIQRVGPKDFVMSWQQKEVCGNWEHKRFHIRAKNGEEAMKLAALKLTKLFGAEAAGAMLGLDLTALKGAAA